MNRGNEPGHTQWKDEEGTKLGSFGLIVAFEADCFTWSVWMDYFGLDCFGWTFEGLSGMDWTGMDCLNGICLDGLFWTGLFWMDLRGTAWNGLDWDGLFKWTVWNGPNRWLFLARGIGFRDL